MLDVSLETVGLLGLMVSVLAHYGMAVSGRAPRHGVARKSL